VVDYTLCHGLRYSTSNLLCELLCQLFNNIFILSGIEPVQYEEKLRNSWVWQELKAVRYAHILHSSSSLGTNYPLNIVMLSHSRSDFSICTGITSVGDPEPDSDPQDPHVFGSRIRIHYSEGMDPDPSLFL
jgi:hypothetical protein